MNLNVYNWTKVWAKFLTGDGGNGQAFCAHANEGPGSTQQKLNVPD